MEEQRTRNREMRDTVFEYLLILRMSPATSIWHARLSSYESIGFLCEHGTCFITPSEIMERIHGPLSRTFWHYFVISENNKTNKAGDDIVSGI